MAALVSGRRPGSDGPVRATAGPVGSGRAGVGLKGCGLRSTSAPSEKDEGAAEDFGELG
jgi:hypothetical protein